MRFLDLRGERFELLQDLRAEFALAGVEIVIELRDFLLDGFGRVAQLAAQVLHCLAPLRFFALDALAQGFGFLLDEGFQGVQAFAHLLAQCLGIFDQPVFQARKALVVIAHLRAEQDVADLLDIGALARLLYLRRRALGIVVGSHGAPLLSLLQRSRPGCRPCAFRHGPEPTTPRWPGAIPAPAARGSSLGQGGATRL